MDHHDLYTPLADALIELERRQKDRALVEKVNQYFASHPLKHPIDPEPHAMIARPLFTPIYEFVHFLEVIKTLPIKTVFYECPREKFVGVNIEKYYLGQMTFYKNGAGNARQVVDSRRVVDFSLSEGKRLDAIKTVWGEPLVDFHRRLMEQYCEHPKIDLRDISDWFYEAHEFVPEHPYVRYLGLFLTHGILFENFLVSDKHEEVFTRTRVMPAFEHLVEKFGVRPLIVPIDPAVDFHEPFWEYYPEKVRDLI